MKLQEKVAIVTGAGRNIGEEMAKLFAQEGAKVIVADCHMGRAEKVAGEINQSGGQALAVEVDVSKSQDVHKMVAATINKFGRIDILVNNAAVAANKSIMEISEEEWDSVHHVILKGTCLCTQYVLKEMVKQGTGGKIVNVSSTSGHRGSKTKCAYAAAKGGLFNFTRHVAITMAPYKIRANTLTPTMSGTAVGKDSGEPERPFQHIPLQRLGRPIDQAMAALFLVSDDSDFITGIDLPVDGGSLAQRGG